MKIYKKVCIVCGKLFETTDNRKTKCSKECNNIYLSLKKKENWKDEKYRKQQSLKIKNGQNNSESKYKMSIKKLGNKYRVGIIVTDKTRKKISKSNKGKSPWNKGKIGIYSEETKRKISENTKLNMTQEVKNRLSKVHKNKVIEEKIKLKISNTLKNRTEEQLKLFIDKVSSTKRKNKTFNTSKPEENIYQLLCIKFKKENIIRQYTSNVYPFNCDFYIPSLDLYIEYKGTWLHGGHLYDKDNEEDLKILEKWKSKNSKFYNNAIYTWTILDIKKINYVKKYNLNYIEFYNINQFLEWYNEQ